MLTLLEAAKLVQDPLKRGVIEIFPRVSPVLERLPFFEVNGQAYTAVKIGTLEFWLKGANVQIEDGDFIRKSADSTNKQVRMADLLCGERLGSEKIFFENTYTRRAR